MNFADVAKEVRQIGAELLADLEATERVSLADLEEECHRRSQGSLTARELAALGHPYSRARGAKLNPNVVNRRSREFDSGWRAEGPKEKGGALVSEVWNESRIAEFFEEGTDRMVPRHPEEAAADAVEPRRLERIERALARHLE